MSSVNSVKKIGVIGGGLIGMSWAVFFLSKGYNVLVMDTDPAAEGRIRDYFVACQATYKESGVELNIDLDNFSFTTVIGDNFDDVDFVQENGPERLEIKQGLIAELEAHLKDDVIIASSSSGLPVSAFQQGAKHPERIVLGHPFNPPHLIPLVEVCGGKLTSEIYIEQALAFYADLGKKPVRLNKEIIGHIANRLQGAIIQEVLYLLKEGVASLENIDSALTNGPGLRWALIGQFMNSNLGGGEGGIRHFLEHLGGPIESWCADLGRIEHITPELIDLAAKGLDEQFHHIRQTQKDVEKARDKGLIKLIAAKHQDDVLRKL